MCCTRDGSAASFAAANDLYAAADAVEALLYPLDAGDKYRAGRTRTNQWDVEKLPDDQAFALMCGVASKQLAQALVPTIFAPLLDDNSAVGAATSGWSDGDALVLAASSAVGTDLGGVSNGVGVCTKAVLAHVADRVVRSTLPKRKGNQKRRRRDEEQKLRRPVRRRCDGKRQRRRRAHLGTMRRKQRRYTKPAEVRALQHADHTYVAQRS
tara:strand:- start:2281 stop:2913 length:633 start_codon:yes stop_codon:yes gene_type:complete